MKKQTVKEINERLEIGDALKIVWGDAHMGTQTPPSLAKELAPTESWGRLVMKKKETVVLAAWISLDPDNPQNPEDDARAFKLITVIPRSNIYRVRVL